MIHKPLSDTSIGNPTHLPCESQARRECEEDHIYHPPVPWRCHPGGPGPPTRCCCRCILDRPFEDFPIVQHLGNALLLLNLLHFRRVLQHCAKRTIIIIPHGRVEPEVYHGEPSACTFATLPFLRSHSSQSAMWVQKRQPSVSLHLVLHSSGDLMCTFISSAVGLQPGKLMALYLEG